MARGEDPHLRGEPDGGSPKQREILAQLEAAIAGMRIREIQMGLRQLVDGSVPPPPAETGAPWAETGAGGGTLRHAGVLHGTSVRGKYDRRR